LTRKTEREPKTFGRIVLGRAGDHVGSGRGQARDRPVAGAAGRGFREQLA
jgi:hypothetical protein